MRPKSHEHLEDDMPVDLRPLNHPGLAYAISHVDKDCPKCKQPLSKDTEPRNLIVGHMAGKVACLFHNECAQKSLESSPNCPGCNIPINADSVKDLPKISGSHANLAKVALLGANLFLLNLFSWFREPNYESDLLRQRQILAITATSLLRSAFEHSPKNSFLNGMFKIAHLLSTIYFHNNLYDTAFILSILIEGHFFEKYAIKVLPRPIFTSSIIAAAGSLAEIVAKPIISLRL